MIWLENHPALARALRRGAVGCALLLGLLCLMLTVPLYLLAQRGANVETAVRASFPGFCSEWRDSIKVSPNLFGLFTTWDVSCVSGFLGLRTALTVNVLTCEARPRWRPSFSLSGMFGALIAPGRKLAVCP